MLPFLPFVIFISVFQVTCAFAASPSHPKLLVKGDTTMAVKDAPLNFHATLKNPDKEEFVIHWHESLPYKRYTKDFLNAENNFTSSWNLTYSSKYENNNEFAITATVYYTFMGLLVTVDSQLVQFSIENNRMENTPSSMTEKTLESETMTPAPNSISNILTSTAMDVEQCSTSISVTERSETNSSVISARINLYRNKMQLSLNFLEDYTLNYLKTIHQNMTLFLEGYGTFSCPNSSASVSCDLDLFSSLKTFEQSDETLENKILQLEQLIHKSRHLLQRMSIKSTTVAESEKKLKEVEKSLKNLVCSLKVENNKNYCSTEEDSDINRKTSEEFIDTSTVDPPIEEPKNVSYTCGGHLTADKGSIIYKIGENLNPYEGCFWMISAGNTSANFIKLHLRTALFYPNQTYYPGTFLSVGYFKNAEYDNPKSFIWNKFKPRSTMATNITAFSPVIFIHFVVTPPDKQGAIISAAPTDYQGFQLDFHAAYVVILPKLYNYTSFYLTGSIGSSYYPQEVLLRRLYSANERTAIVVQPTSDNSTVTVDGWDLADNYKRDSLNVWTFGRYYTWYWNQWISGKKKITEEKKIYNLSSGYPRTDPVLLLFKSDIINHATGFDFQWK